MKTIVYVAHPDTRTSQSQQFLLSSGRALTDATYVDLQAEWQVQEGFDVKAQRERLLTYDRIILQFPLYWYQAPAILKQWLDEVWLEREIDPIFARKMAGKELGLVVIVGVKASHYQAGGREGRSLSELLSPYQALANYFDCHYLPHLTVSQFEWMTELDRGKLMYRYGNFLTQGEHISQRAYQRYVSDKLDGIDMARMQLDPEQAVVFDVWKQAIDDQADDLDEFYNLTDRW